MVICTLCIVCFIYLFFLYYLIFLLLMFILMELLIRVNEYFLFMKRSLEDTTLALYTKGAF